MQLDHLRYLLVIDQTGSINKASAQLHTSPQNISRILTQIENELALDLYVRTKSGILFTDKGKALLDFARTTLLNFDQFLQTARDDAASEDIYGEITVYSTNLLTELWVNDLIIKFHELYPNITINNIETDLLIGYQRIQSEPEAFGLLCDMEELKDYPDISATQFDSSSIIALVNRNSPLAAHNSVSMQTILQHKVLCFAHTAFPMTEASILLAPFLDDNAKIVVTSNLNAYYKFVAKDNYISFATLEGYKKQQSIYKNEIVGLTIQETKNTPLIFSILSNKKANYAAHHKKWVSFLMSFFQLEHL